MKTPRLALSLAAGLLLADAGSAGAAELLTVAHRDGLLTVRCDGATLSQVFEQIKAATGMELILEEPVRSTRLTADIEAQPVNLAIQRLLEGSGVNYAMFFDRSNWGRVARMYVGSGGGPPGQTAASTRAETPVRGPFRRQAGEVPADEEQPVALEEALPGDEAAAEELREALEEALPGQAGQPQGFAPTTPSFPRSSFTPGLESFPRPAGSSSTGASAPAPGMTSPSPPANYPFLDPFGRPIPVPAGTTPAQQLQQRREQQRPPQQE